MKERSWFVAAGAALAIAIGAVGAAAPASAAPPTAAWSGDAGGDVASVTASAVGLDVADLGVAVSSARAGSTASPRAVSSSSNISAVAAGLPIAVSTESVSAPPDAGPDTGGIAASVTGLIDVGAITTTNEAHWGLDAACITSGALSSATTQTAGLAVLPAVSGGVVSLGVSQSKGETSLVQNSGLNYGLQSVGSGTVTGLSILGGAVTVDVAGETTLTATASGTATGTVSYAPATVTVTSSGGSVVLTPAAPSTTVTVIGVGSVTVGLNTPTETTTATSASASVALLTVDVRLPAAPLPALTQVSVDVLPLQASATAPAGGIDCPPAPPVITAPADGATTNATPTISGTSAPNASVEVFIDGGSVGTTSANGSGVWQLPLVSALTAGPHSATATQTVSGTTSAPSVAVGFTVDATAPAAPVITTPVNGSTTGDSTPAITGTAEPDSTVTVSIDGTTAGTTTASGIGAWTFTPAAPLGDSSHTAVATATDAGGNVSPNSNTVTFTVDTTAPPAPVITAPANGSTTGDNTPAIAGTAEPNATVAVTIDGTTAGTTAASGTGDWTFTPAAPLGDGPHSAVAAATDAGGNAGPNSNTVAFTVDTSAPVAPTITAPVTGSTTGDNTPAITGSAEANATVAVTIDGAFAGVTVADGTGAWAFTPIIALADGPHTVVVTATDAGGNVSPNSNTVAFTVDTTPPPAPVITAPANGSTTGDNTPAITGTAEPGSTVTVSIDGTPAGTTTASGTGAWTFTPATPLTDGSHTVVAAAGDAGGNVGPNSNTVAFIVDTTAPVAPVITAPVTGTVVTTDTPAISGTAEPNTTVTITIDGNPAGTTPADGTGAWSAVPPTPLSQGAHSVVATATDAGGNVSPNSNTVAFTVDSIAPVAPLISAPTDGSTTGDSTPAISGVAEPNSTVSITIDGASAGTTTASGTGAWSFTPSAPLGDGPHTTAATSTDAGGNVSPNSNTVTFIVDTTAPGAPVVTAPSDGSTTGDSTPAITGTAKPNATVIVMIDGTTAGTATANGTGTWTFTPSTPLADGDHTVTATATDAAGNVGPESAEVAFTVDTAPPAAPIVTGPVAGSTTTDTTPTVTGTAEPGSTVTVIIDGVLIGSATADGNGAWSVTPTTPLGAGDHTVTATATDPAGNVGPASAPVRFTVSALAATAPSTPPSTAQAAAGGLAATGGVGPTAALLLGTILVTLGMVTVSRRRRTS